MGHIDMSGPKGYGFSAILVINRVLILAILVINRVWFLHSSLELGTCFLEEANLIFIIINKTMNKSPSQCLYHRSELGNELYCGSKAGY